MLRRDFTNQQLFHCFRHYIYPTTPSILHHHHLHSINLRKQAMSALLPLLLSAISFVSLLHRTTADPTDGFTAVPLSNSNFQIQKPYDKAVSERYSFINGVHRFWVYDNDKPFKPDSPTKPRTEIRITGYDYSSGVWQFEGNLYIPSGTTGTSVMQIHRSDTGTAMMLRVYNGQLWFYRSDVVESNVYDRWMRINVIHDVRADRVTVFVNGVQKLQKGARGPSTFDFKCGVYTQNDPSHYMESRWRGIRILKK